MKRIRSILCLSLCAALSVGMLTGCSGGDASSSADNASSIADSPAASADAASPPADDGEALSIHYLTCRNTEEAVVQSLQKVADTYAESHPGFSFEVESITDRTSYLQKVKILASSNELPEWFESDPDTFFAELVAEGLLYDIEALYEELGVSDNFFKISKDYARLSDGSLNLITLQCNTEYFFYNKNLFEQAGIQDLPSTLDDLLAVCGALTDNGITPIAMGGSWPIFRYFAFLPFRQTGNQYLEDACAGTGSWGTEIGLENAAFMQNLAQYFQTGWTTADDSTMNDLFSSGQTAMLYNGTWVLPDLVDENMELRPEFGYFHMPAYKENDVTTATDYFANSGIGVAILKDKMTPAMKDYLAYVFDNYADICMFEYNQLPSIMPSSTDGLPEIYQNIIQDVSAVNTYAKCWDVVIDSASLETLNKESTNLVLGTITPQEWADALDEVVKRNKAA